MKAYAPIRWTLNNAAKEFDCDPKTLTKYLTQNAITAVDGTYSTAQICAAVFGDMHGEKLGKLRAERINAETKTEEARRLLLDEANATVADYGTFVRSTIQSAAYIPAEAKARLLRALADGDILPKS